ncbi:MAG: (Fe-S)-binding protein, partial [Alistipes sp.]|nr:(Fe-S)-binding protein [Alistipes sp.]
ALWLIFPARLLAESMTSAEVWRFGGIVWALGEEQHLIPPGVGCGSFLTNTTGELLARVLPDTVLQMGELPAWWIYSCALGLFFFALPFSRYMHIFTEIPLIFLRNAGIHSQESPTSYDKFQSHACSRCGICIDPCQLQRAGIQGVQSVYFLRDRRYGHLTDAVANNCLMCGRCERACPVSIEQNQLRLNSRAERAVPCTDDRYHYIQGIDRSQGSGKVGYFAGCMTLLTPKILHAMEEIFTAAQESVWWADREGSVCCGRPLKLSGEIEAAHRMMRFNEELFRKHGITTLVTSCPICLRVFRKEYQLEGIEVLHHSEYIQRLILSGRLKPKAGTHHFTYHDPCELGRGLGIYQAPREVIEAIGTLSEPVETREKALCCGSSVANLAIDDEGQRRIGESVTQAFVETGADTLVTACPLCKKSLSRSNAMPVRDLSEIVAEAL